MTIDVNEREINGDMKGRMHRRCPSSGHEIGKERTTMRVKLKQMESG
jgi:hypothetical protein